jgi:hypothetical protein
MLAEAAKVHLATIVGIEQGERMVQDNVSTIMKIQRASSEKEYSLPPIRTGNWRETEEEAPARLILFCETKPKLPARISVALSASRVVGNMKIGTSFESDCLACSTLTVCQYNYTDMDTVIRCTGSS